MFKGLLQGGFPDKLLLLGAGSLPCIPPAQECPSFRERPHEVHNLCIVLPFPLGFGFQDEGGVGGLGR